jgi:nicotinate-nucleotide adenylyltransferase
MKKVGLFGGSFNPIHIGHLWIAESTRDAFQLEKVIYIPAGKNPYKTHETEEERHHRYQMVQLGIESNPYFDISDVEINKSGNTYTIDTIHYFMEKFPEYKLYFITGSDLMFQINLWKEAKTLMESIEIVTAVRPGYADKELELQIDFLTRNYQAKIHLFHTPELDISSSEIRDRIRKGMTNHYLLPTKVEDYIRKNQLYCSNHEK